MKALFQELCVEKLGWDDELNEGHKERWDSWVKDLVKTKVITFNRCLYYNIQENVLASYLHGLGDASNLAYCAVVYFVYESGTGTYVKMLTSKTRVAPLKPLTIPRLELMSARILASLVDKVKKALEDQVQIAETRYWSDSKTALCWIENKGERKQFVRHRVNDILKLTEKKEWGHCPGKDNPADLGTRGLTASKLEKSDLWWLGPEWLRGPKEGWPERQEIGETPESTEEQKKAAVSTVKVSETVSIENVIDVHRYSSREKLGFHYLSKVRDHFWNRWRREYLTDLREYDRGKCESQVRTVSIGDVVIVFEENVKRGLWKIGKVEEVIRGRDGVVRGAKVKVMTKGKPVLLNRPVQKLYPLEVRTETLKPPVGAKQDDNKTGGEVNGRETVVGARGTPRRPAALDAGWKCRLMLDSDSS